MHPVIVRMGLLRRKPDLSQAQFSDHWIRVHGPIAARLPGLRRYHQNHVVDSHQTVAGPSRSDDVVDGISELWFDDVAAMDDAIRSDACRPLAADEPNLAGSVRLIVAERESVVESPEVAPVSKRMTLVKRSPATSPDSFRQLWFGTHAGLASKLPGLRGLTLNFITQRWLQRGIPARYEDVPIDGIAELWFDDVAAARSAGMSLPGRQAGEHMKTFIADVAEFGVEVHEVVADVPSGLPFIRKAERADS
jgi:uncharacterized protein (TIGR02118 family)